MPGLLVNFAFLHPQPTGLATYALNLLPYLTELEAQIASPLSLPVPHLIPTPKHMTAQEGLAGHARRLWWTQWQLPQIYRQLHSRLLFSPIPEAPLWQNCRFVVTVHDLIPLRFGKWSSRLSNYFRFVVPQILQQATHILCNSHSTAQEVGDFFQIKPDRLTVIPLAFDPDRFYCLHLPTANYFLYIGRHDRHKNLPRLIQAFQQVDRDYELWISGSYDQRYTPALVRLVEELELRERVKFIGYIERENLCPLLNQAVALVLPSLWEGFGLPVLEAMACGTPVITANLSALPETAGDAALLVDPYNVDDIADKMKALTRSDALRAQLRQLGLERVKHFSWQKTGRATVAVLANYL
ncbi:MAG: glycosyltransferase family 1 protein [Pseudanabaenaceae cyanobacterium SKYGB_i_bin29]|nr:glycosyltransferase family 4 protein [Pseudanabaenaceae cyanobacterium SKYG29]MDW8421803.1 glycosyltransferase family 1 protein [Pseudanabaenaceae cyanobacterium SKYGB_i_bin29]